MKKPIKAYGGHGLSVIYEFADGTGVMRYGGEIGWRSTNPGNIKTGNHSQEYGSIGNNGQFVIFPDFATGRQGIFKLLNKFYLHLTLEKAFYKYAPREDKNDTEAYIKFVMKRTGYKRTDSMGKLKLGPIVDAIIKWEGYWAGEGQTKVLEKLKKKYKWRTQKDPKVREEHKKREGDIFSWDDPPYDGHPGEAFGCRCWAEAHKYERVEKSNPYPSPNPFQIQFLMR